MINTVEMELGGRTLYIESGKVAGQADGAVIVRYGGTVVLASAVASKEPVAGRDFFPLTVEFREKYYAAGKIPGGFFKREGRPSEGEILAARMVDRSLRPLFPEGYKNEVQIMVMVLSSDQENNADVPGIIGASAALAISPIPFERIVGAVRIGKLGERLIVNPTFSQADEGEMDIVVSATSDSIVQMEGSAREIAEQELVEAISLAQEQIQKICQLQQQLEQLCGKPKLKVPELPGDPELERSVREQFAARIGQANRIAEKTERNNALEQIVQEAVGTFSEEYPEAEEVIKAQISKIQKEQIRRMVLEENRRIDGRGLEDIRPISCEVGVLPRTHGSALFTRGQTQSLATTTLGTKLDEQKIEALEGESWKSYMLHYNFPPFSVGEVKPIRGVSRREIGHGNLAERALEPVIPSDEVFPYTIRIVSDILESNGSSSMATVCAGSLSLMDAGVPVKTSVAGVAMGLVKEGDRAVVLTDIAGLEDHYGDIDFKVAGTRNGITAVQLDTKIRDLSPKIIAEALQKAHKARLEILDIMDQTISEPRPELSSYAPRIISFKIKPSQIGEVIGTGGKVIREITESTGATINIDDDGTVTIASVDKAAGEKAVEIIQEIIAEPELNKLYTGKVKRITPFGAFVEILRGKEGLLHISEVDSRRIDRIEDVLKIGDEVLVKVIGMDDSGKIRLSRKAALQPQQRMGRKQRPKGRRFF
ncbi:MAG: polyribonucleotide nucleotidyltransferase [Candidatus Latescibacteria bacterium 4484_181]|nr:MAG: polyribonucleotide nucleotidyltransferase [Candidatus Latescibacteria bacterium 4484_181]RKY73360.1 MAG: polyribonucleotide nucleotidyltransferase [Candidatus Latescibacterota bacterium]